MGGSSGIEAIARQPAKTNAVDLCGIRSIFTSGIERLGGLSYAEMMDEERNLGEQPIAAVMDGLNLSPHDLVVASTEQLTHKMVSRARKGRRLTTNTRGKVIRALEAASGQTFPEDALFNY